MTIFLFHKYTILTSSQSQREHLSTTKDPTNVHSKLTSCRSFSRNWVQTKSQDTVDMTTGVGEDLRGFHSGNFSGGLSILDDIRWVFGIYREGQDSICGQLEDDTAQWPYVHGCWGRVTMFRGPICIVGCRDVGLWIIYSWRWEKRRRQAPVADFPGQLRSTKCVCTNLFCQYYVILVL